MKFRLKHVKSDDMHDAVVMIISASELTSDSKELCRPADSTHHLKDSPTFKQPEIETHN